MPTTTTRNPCTAPACQVRHSRSGLCPSCRIAARRLKLSPAKKRAISKKEWRKTPEGKAAAKKAAAAYYLRNKERIRKKNSAWYEKHGEAIKEKRRVAARLRYAVNKDKARATRRKHYQKNPTAEYQRTAKRLSKLAQATPSWVDTKEIRATYRLRKSGECVDHIFPINSPDICGLHVPWNLQILSKEESSVKGNQFDFTYENNGWRLRK